jgi:hypothetical protein
MVSPFMLLRYLLVIFLCLEVQTANLQAAVIASTRSQHASPAPISVLEPNEASHVDGSSNLTSATAAFAEQTVEPVWTVMDSNVMQDLGNSARKRSRATDPEGTGGGEDDADSPAEIDIDDPASLQQLTPLGTAAKQWVAGPSRPSLRVPRKRRAATTATTDNNHNVDAAEAARCEGGHLFVGNVPPDALHDELVTLFGGPDAGVARAAINRPRQFAQVFTMLV